MSATELNINKYLNGQNLYIYKELRKEYNIKLYLDNSVSSWLIENDKPIIRTPKDDLNIASFTHELLHLYVEYKGHTRPNIVFNNIFHIDVLISINRAHLIEHITNVNAHKKMFPIFKKLGFKDEEFVQNTGSFFCLSSYIIVRICKSLNIFPKFWISQFIGHAFALKNDVVESRLGNNKKYLFLLSKLDKELYKIIYYFDIKWSRQMDLDCWDNYLELSNNLLDWLNKNNLNKNNSKQS